MEAPYSFTEETRLLEPICTVATKDTKPGDVDCPYGITVNTQNQLVISDSGKHCVKLYERTKFRGNSIAFSYIALCESNGRRDMQCNRPFGICCDSSGRVLICDCYNNRIQVFKRRNDSSGTYEYSETIGNSVLGEGELKWPHSITVDYSDNVYVLDCKRISVFSKRGNYLNELNIGGDKLCGVFFNRLYVSCDKVIMQYDLRSSSMEKVPLHRIITHELSAVTVCNDGRMIVADVDEDNNLSLVFIISASGSQVQASYRYSGLVSNMVLIQDNILAITDSRNHRVHIVSFVNMDPPLLPYTAAAPAMDVIPVETTDSKSCGEIYTNGKSETPTIITGWVVIINNETFTKESKLKKRNGSEKDIKELLRVFRTFGLKIKVYRNLPAAMMEWVFKEYSEKNHGEYDIFVMCVLTHGEENELYGQDGRKVAFRDMVKFYTSESCPSLDGKLKLFFLQACQGRDTLEADDIGHVCDDKIKYFLPDTDMVLAYPTQAGYKSWRDAIDGSWFIQTLCSALDTYGEQKSIIEILSLVEDMVSEMKDVMAYTDKCGNKTYITVQQIPFIMYGLNACNYDVKFSRIPSAQ